MPIDHNMDVQYQRSTQQTKAACRKRLHAESRKTLEQKFIFQIGTLNPHGINERFSFN